MTGRKAGGAARTQPSSFVLGFVFLVLFPAFVTIVAPVSRVNLSYDGDVVSARVRWFVFLVVPYRTTSLERVDRVGSDFTAGHLERNRDTQGRRRDVRTEDTAALVLGGPDGELSVPVSPVNIDQARERVREFLENPDRAGLSFLAVSNWKFGVIAGGLVSLFTLLYLVGVVLSIATWGYRTARGLARADRGEELKSAS